jgi:ABC-type bacteriocin/lantibiotic exporter with double-glycine peptidase domain
MRFKYLLLFALAFSSIGLVAFGDEDITLPILFETQERKRWCWAACSQTLAETKGKSFSQCEIAGLAITGDKNGCKGKEAEYDKIGFVDTALKACGINCYGRPGTLTYPEIVEQLKKEQPIAIRVMPPGYKNAHFVVIYGIKGEKLKIWDPEHQGKKLEVTKQEMENSVGRWLNTITLDEPPKLEEPFRRRTLGDIDKYLPKRLLKRDLSPPTHDDKSMLKTLSAP